jgi:hypothetical protein
VSRSGGTIAAAVQRGSGLPKESPDHRHLTAKRGKSHLVSLRLVGFVEAWRGMLACGGADGRAASVISCRSGAVLKWGLGVRLCPPLGGGVGPFALPKKKWGPALLPAPTAPSEGFAGIRNLVL